MSIGIKAAVVWDELEELVSASAPASIVGFHIHLRFLYRFRLSRAFEPPKTLPIPNVVTWAKTRRTLSLVVENGRWRLSSKGIPCC